MLGETIADRLKALREERRLSPTQVAERLGIPLPTLYAHENGSREPDKENLFKYAAFYHTSVDELVTNRRGVTNVTFAPIVGYINHGGVISLHPQNQEIALERVPAPQGVSAECSAARILDDSVYPFRNGWLVFWSTEGQRQTPDEFLGELCVVQLTDGRLMLRELHRGSVAGLYRLNIHNAPPTGDVAVEWAAPVLGMTMPR